MVRVTGKESNRLRAALSGAEPGTELGRGTRAAQNPAPRAESCHHSTTTKRKEIKLEGKRWGGGEEDNYIN